MEVTTVDTWRVNDGFNFGEPARHPAKLGARRSPIGPSAFDGRIVWVVGGLVVAAVAVFVFLRGADEAGHEIADARSDEIATVDRAEDVAAQASVSRAVIAARTAFAERGSFSIDEATLSAFDPSLHFTSGASSGPTSVAFEATDIAFGAAVRSESGTCWWARIDASGVTTYGGGQSCTGRAALAASDPSW